ncbi:MAG: RsmB/NOP family class I SAM-dependent RNA methyltransferase [Sediminimonas qiaohouensis]|uniref:RsmB/NOP family class I SAM-dependent RNA methyltransferase n=1 Tax=Sediminimonas qiaohouensis TaxID=552061 RepID=A0A7C9HAQ3_9RHOB|nr:RsmB/NOP family class I SAM-dependent RNA methyltransferase [Sediminimonas qiaohouensis]MTJ04344.1 RsmB/NOP family class I SAM-dependent RNA methyltransferase [Sediminimonas qiaohouensis]
MTPAARIAAASEVLDKVLAGAAAEQALTGWARGARYAGSGDRAAVRDHVFDALRRLRSAAARGGGMTGRAVMIGLLRERGEEPGAYFTGQGHAPAPLSDEEARAGRSPEGAEAMDLPDWLWTLLREAEGDERAADLALQLRERAPVMLRVNLRKGARADAINMLAEDGVDAAPDSISPTALKVNSGARRIRAARAYTNGLVELQDGASQSVVDELRLVNGMKVLDFCAGGGGKTLAMAARADIELFAHDADPGRMRDLPQRALRAGATVRQVTLDDARTLAPFDLVLCDAPCSGSGAWRRAPDAKWRLDPDALARLQALQDQILDQAATLVAQDGTLAYATCSILGPENDARVDAFLARHETWTTQARRHWDPGPSGDGFFVAQLLRRRD